MTYTDAELIRRAFVLIDRAVALPPQTGPVVQFVANFLEPQRGRSLTTEEAYTFYCEIAAASDLPPISIGDFQRRLPAAMWQVYQLRKRHDLRRGGQTKRGFCHIDIKLTA